MIIIKLKETEEFFVKAKFAALNKNHTLKEYEKECKIDYYWEKTKIIKVVLLNNEEYSYYKNNLLENVTFLECGGNSSDYMENVCYMDLSETDRAIWRKQSYGVGVLVKKITNGEQFVINDQGYKYARYVGLEVTEC